MTHPDPSLETDNDCGLTLTSRKEQHLDVVLAGQAGATVTTGLETVLFEHIALPEVSWHEVDLSTEFLGHAIDAPVMIGSMTGGPRRAGAINRTLAQVCQQFRLPLAVGSQRVMIEGGEAAGLDGSLRRLAPDIPILANFGAAQLNRGFGRDQALRAIEAIGASALILHLNPLQEAVQPEGDRDWRGLTAKIGALARALPVPVVVDHMGHFPTSAGLDDPGFQTLVALVRDGAWVKLSGAYRLTVEGPPYRDTVPFARALHAAAPDRCVWGSDWPFVGRQNKPDYAATLAMLSRWVPDAATRRTILNSTPSRLFGLGKGVGA